MKGQQIHPTAVIARDAHIGKNVDIGPFVFIGPKCEIGDGCIISARVLLERNVILSNNVCVGAGTILGGAPQDLKYAGEETRVEIGEGTTIREFTTINRGTSHSFKTSVGKNCFIMSYVHLAHDCHVGDGVILANVVQLAGHVIVEDNANIAGVTAVHQFVRIGRHSFIGGCSRVAKDIPPFLKAVGNPVKLYGLNSVGLQRSGFPDAVTLELKRAYRLFFRSDLNVSQAVDRAERELEPFAEVRELIDFVEASQRGVVV